MESLIGIIAGLIFGIIGFVLGKKLATNDNSGTTTELNEKINQLNFEKRQLEERAAIAKENLQATLQKS